LNALFALTILMLLMGACSAGPMPTPAEPPAPDFKLTALDGHTYQLSALRGRWVLVNFWATWCVPCVTELPALQSLADEWAGELTLLAINQREDAEVVRTFAAEHSLRFPILLHPDDTVLIGYQVVGLPQTVLIDPAGQMRYRTFGPIELEAFRAVLAELVRG
jgi:peroxiredoxin